jgi:hypothetical protein
MAISNQVFKKPKKIFLNFICTPLKTYTVGSEADMALYKERVLPVIN